jgi:hypothetical protein
MDTVIFNGEDFEIQSNLKEDEVRESMAHIFPSAANALIERVEDEKGAVTWLFEERGGDKGR